jgi:hypothetical protein
MRQRTESQPLDRVRDYKNRMSGLTAVITRHTMTMIFRVAVAVSLYATCISATSWIAPGAVWYDTSGAKIDAHGGMIIKPGNVWYWVCVLAALKFALRGAK